MVSKSWKLRFSACHKKVKLMHSLMENPLAVNGAEISRIGVGFKLAKIERNLQAPR
jgi:hypothetical protein